MSEMIEQPPGLMDIRAAVQELKEKEISFDEAVVMLVQSHGLTWNAAADTIRGAQAITGIALEGGIPDRLVSPPAGIATPEPSNSPSEPQERQEEAAQAPQEPSEILHCTICQKVIPETRARRQTSTCSEKCKNRLDVIRAHQRAAKRCPSCLSPSTPEERESYRLWRVDRGDLRSAGQIKRDRTLPSKTDMRHALQRAIYALTEQRDTLQAQLEASNALETKIEGKSAELSAASEKQRRQAEYRLERLTTLIRVCEATIAPKV